MCSPLALVDPPLALLAIEFTVVPSPAVVIASYVPMQSAITVVETSGPLLRRRGPAVKTPFQTADNGNALELETLVPKDVVVVPFTGRP